MVHQARTRDRMLIEAARLFARQGFRGTSTEDIGTACGISGPGVYKHFRSKGALLSHLLLDISQQLRDGGQAVAKSAADPRAALKALVAFHADFAVGEPDLIRVQDRDLGALAPADSRRVRQLQRTYVELWVGLLQELSPDLPDDTAHTRVHATFGLLNSTPHSGSNKAARRELVAMAERALGLS